MASSLFSNKTTQQSNPLIDIMEAIKTGQNPRDFVQQMASKNPVWQQVNNTIGMQSPQQIGAQIDRDAKGRGTNLNALMSTIVRNLGLPIK